MPDGPPDILAQRYTRLSRQPLHSLVMVLPLLMFFHLAVLFLGHRQFLDLLNAHRDIARCLSFFGATGLYLPAVAVAAVLLGQHLLAHCRFELRPGAVAAMFGEAALWAAPLLAMGLLIGQLTSANTPTDGFSKLVIAVGAGIYEEFLFRLLLNELILLVCVDVMGLSKHGVAAAAVMVSAIAFSLYHPGVWADHAVFAGPLRWRKFFFFASAGVYLAGLYLLRGFGIGVGAHVWYNLAALAID